MFAIVMAIVITGYSPRSSDDIERECSSRSALQLAEAIHHLLDVAGSSDNTYLT
jgi:hypothetical protein